MPVNHHRRVRARHALGVSAVACGLVGGCYRAAEPNVQSTNESAVLTMQQKIAVVSYFRNSKGLWDAMLTDTVPPVAIVMINPADGPDEHQSATIAALVSQAHSANAFVIGYVTSKYKTSSVAEVEAQINRYYDWYEVDGIFIDEAKNDCRDVAPYYLPLYGHVKSKDSNAIVVLNPGTNTPSCYLDAADIIVTFEDDYLPYLSSYTMTDREWEAANPHRVWHIIKNATSRSELEHALDLSRERNAGYVYVRGDTFSRLPSFWDAEVTNVKAWNDGHGGGSGGLSFLRASNDATSNVYRFEFPAGTHSFRRVYIDTDASTSSGFAYCGLGGDYLIESSRLYDYTGDGSSWSWTDLGSVKTVHGSTSAQWTVARSSLGESASPNTSNACFEIKTSGGVKTTSSVYHHAYSDESGPVHAYFAANDDSTIRYGATFAKAYAQKHVFIDADMSAGTGYSVGGIGADFMIENGGVYDYTGTGGRNWRWTWLGTSSMSPSTMGAIGATTWSIARSTIGEIGTGQTSRLVFHGRDSGGSSQYATPIYTHTFSN
jgi:hypothetical protein